MISHHIFNTWLYINIYKIKIYITNSGPDAATTQGLLKTDYWF